MLEYDILFAGKLMFDVEDGKTAAKGDDLKKGGLMIVMNGTCDIE